MEKTSGPGVRLIVLGIVSAVITSVGAPAGLALRTFERSALLENPEENSAGVSVGDLNSDGWPDIVFGKGHHTPLHNRVLLNDGQGHFVAENLGNTPDRTYSAALTDVDRDGDLDIIISNDLPDRKPIHKNDGKGNFTLAGFWGEPNWPTRHVSIADLNADGYPDIVAANAGASIPLPIYFPSFICLNDRTGAFPSCRPLPSESAVRIKAADFDGNGTIDLFVPHRDGGRSFILWNDGKGFVQRTSFRHRTFIGPETASIRVSDTDDFNRDGRTDLVVVTEQREPRQCFSTLRNKEEPAAGNNPQTLRGRTANGAPVSLPVDEGAGHILRRASLNLVAVLYIFGKFSGFRHSRCGLGQRQRVS